MLNTPPPHFPEPDCQVKYITRKDKYVSVHHLGLQGSNCPFAVPLQQVIKGRGHASQKEEAAMPLSVLFWEAERDTQAHGSTEK